MKLLSALCLLFLVSCASQGPSKSFDTNLTLIHTVDRQLEFEPCGCTFRPLGGIEREWQYIQALKKDGRELLYLVSGKTFFAEGSKFTKSQTDGYKAKAVFLMEAFQKLGVSVIAPSFSDLNLGEKYLKEEAKKHGLKLVATNLQTKSGKPVFETALEISFNGMPVIILSVLSQKSVKALPQFKLEDAEVAIKNVLSKKKSAAFVVLLTDGDENFRTKISRKFSEINMVLGSEGDSTPFQAYQLQKRAAHASVRGRGKSVLQVDMDIKLPIVGMFSEKISDQTTQNEILWKNKKEIRDGEEVVSEYLLQLAAVPRKFESNFSRYEVRLVDLDEKQDSKASQSSNPMTDIVARMKEKVRKINMADE